MNYKPMKSPWITKGIVKSIRVKNKLYMRAKNDPSLKPAYTHYRNQLTSIIRKAKQQYHRNTLNSFKNNSSKLWSHLNSLIKTKTPNSTPVTPEKLNNFFTSVFKQAPIRPIDQPCTVKSNFVTNSFFLKPVSHQEIISNMLTFSNSQFIGSDGLNPIIIKSTITYLARPLEYIFNLSFATGIFPKLMKDAIVTPIFKNGDNLEPGNYRPISILTIFSKLLEKLFYNRLIQFVNNNSILHDNQFGFCAGKSTSTAIACVLTSILNKINNKKPTIFALLDLKKAFDFINHELLLTKLNCYGIRGIPLSWLKSYLTNRRQRTKANDNFSTYKLISAGVPQGSILGPLIFILFINDIFQFCSNNVEILLYADDTAILFHADNDL
jgi:retron-type reverse transcriptase